jgi:hypothetical protein
LGFTDALGSNIYSLIWLIFILIIGIALAVDIGALDKAKKFVNKRATKSSNKNKNKNLSDQEKESKVIIPLHKESSLEQQQQLQTFRRTLHWTILWIYLAETIQIM